MNIMEISVMQNLIEMRMEVIKYAKKRKCTEDDVWDLINNFRRIHEEGRRPRVAVSTKDIIKSILPDKKQFKFTESPIEDLLKWELQARYINFETRVAIGGYKVDFLFPQVNLIVEADGREYHSSPDQQDRDFKRQLYLIKKGYTVLRFTGSQIYRDVVSCVDKIERLL